MDFSSSLEEGALFLRKRRKELRREEVVELEEEEERSSEGEGLAREGRGEAEGVGSGEGSSLMGERHLP